MTRQSALEHREKKDATSRTRCFQSFESGFLARQTVPMALSAGFAGGRIETCPRAVETTPLVYRRLPVFQKLLN